MYIICWRNKLTGANGKSELVWPKSIAQEMVDDLNKHLGETTEHWIEDEDMQPDGYFYEPKQKTPRTSRDTKTPQTDRTG